MSCVRLLLVVAILANLSLGFASASANLLSDPGFELSKTDGTFPSSGYWKPAWASVQAGAVCTSTAAREGNAGLWEYTGAGVEEWWTGPYQDVPASPGDTFTGNVWARSQSDWIEGSKALLRLTFLDGSGCEIASKDSPALTSQNSDWQQLTVTTDLAPLGTATVRFRLYLEKPKGTAGQSIANFDDCTLVKVVSGGPRLSVSRPSLGFGSDLTTLSFNIKNAGTGTLSWTVLPEADWMQVSPSSGTSKGENVGVTVTVDRTRQVVLSRKDAVTIASNGGNQAIDVYVEREPLGAVPEQPSLMVTSGRQLLVQRRLPHGVLDVARPYAIRGVAWSPAGIGTTGAYSDRRSAFQGWYRLDIQLLREMNANTVYVFLDFGTDQATIDQAKKILDYCYQNGIMVVMTVDEDGTDNKENIPRVVNAFKNHPAILMWALGNEWNLLRQDRDKYYVHYDTLLQAADAMQANAQQIKFLDASHPVCSILGEISLPEQADAIKEIVTTRCSAVDVWGVNVYRGPDFGTLFEEWKVMSTKPLYISEFGTDAFRTAACRPPVGYEDEPMQAERLRSLWRDLAEELSAKDPAKVCLGGTVFEWNDEWWKSTTGSAIVHDPDGFETTWNPAAHPDGFANEEWFGIVPIDRRLRLAYFALREEFAKLLDRGDIDRNGMLDLVDAVLVLQNLVGILPPSSVGKEGDVNGDGRIGLEETIYIMQELAGLRLKAANTVSPCKTTATGVDQSYPAKLSAEVVEGKLVVHHLDAVYNCCAEDVTVAVTMTGNVIELYETEVVRVPCDCLCPRDITTEIVGLPPQIYAIYVRDARGLLGVIEDVVIPGELVCSANSQCGSGFFCDKPAGDCDGQGRCRPRPQACITLYDPVCGCDGRTYGNSCDAATAGVSVAYKGSCAGPDLEPRP